jgi:hypothetical protein
MSDVKLKILFLSNGYEDYLRMSFLHGFRQLKDVECVDVPKLRDCYQPDHPDYLMTRRGYGFSLYGLLKDSECLEKKRKQWKAEINTYDIIILTDLNGLWQKISSIKKRIKKGARIAIIDGADSPAFFPFEAIWTNFKRTPAVFLKSFKGIPWYKREWMPGESLGTLSRFLPNQFSMLFESSLDIRPISYAFPAEKITSIPIEEKIKDFNHQVVDKEVAECLGLLALHNPIGSDSYVFETEESFYKDFQQSRFGITTKRAGWDSLRNY